MNPKRSAFSAADFSFGLETPVLFKTKHKHYRIGTAASLMAVDMHGDEAGLKIGDEQVSSWTPLPLPDDRRWSVKKKPYDEPLLVLYRSHDGSYRYVVEFRVFKNWGKSVVPLQNPPCIGWMHAEEAFQPQEVAASHYVVESHPAT